MSLPPPTTAIFHVDRYVDQTGARVVEVRTEASGDVLALLNAPKAFYGVIQLPGPGGVPFPLTFPIAAATTATIQEVFAQYDSAVALALAQLQSQSRRAQLAAGGNVRFPPG